VSYNRPKILLLFSIFIFSSIHLVAQDYVTLSASASKKEFAQSENVKIILKATVQSGFHINANSVSDEDLIPTTLKFNDGDFKLSKVSWPSPKKYKFSFSETELEVYEGTISISLSLKPKKDIKPGKYEVSGSLNYQACNDRSCFAPKNVEFSASFTVKEDSVKQVDTLKNKVEKDTVKNLDTVKTQNKIDSSAIIKKSTEQKSDTASKVLLSEKSSTGNDVANYLKEKGLFLTLILIFIGGLALNLTPCIYPLIPITISFFGAQVNKNKAQQFILSIVYVLGMSVTYTILGLVAALTGGLFGSALQNPIVVVVIALIMFSLALSMFGLFEIRIPQSIANFSGKSRQGYVGTALMGLTVGFIAAPCIGPFVLSLLVYVGQLGSPFMGFLFFFVLSLGLGLPYIFLALFSSSISKLPRSGEWMEGVKIVFGLIMIGLAIYTLQTIISHDIFSKIFPVYIILAGVYLILFDNKALKAAGYTKIKFAIAIAAIIWGSSGLHFEDKTQTLGKVEWQSLTSKSEIEKSISSAKEKITMIDFTADWCAACKELEKFTYTDPKVIESSKSFNKIKVDLTKENSEISSRFKILGLPVVAFIKKDGTEFDDLRITGFMKAEDFLKVMDKALNK
jgi:thioredoxin:protein disulfide reductase